MKLQSWTWRNIGGSRQEEIRTGGVFRRQAKSHGRSVGEHCFTRRFAGGEASEDLRASTADQESVVLADKVARRVETREHEGEQERRRSLETSIRQWLGPDVAFSGSGARRGFRSLSVPGIEPRRILLPQG